ncbi:MAG: phenylalanine--tRNA ligase subunit alpha [Waddliaceae bacterium]
MKQFEEIRKEFQQEIESVDTTENLEQLRIKYLGRKGSVQALMPHLKDLPQDQRPQFGEKVNILKNTISEKLQERTDLLIAKEEESRLQEEVIDISLPGKNRFAGRKHIINQTLDEMIDGLIEMGFSVQYGPDIDNDFYNFEALNFPPDHPARDMQDTFYLSPDMLLRTHTSNIQIRVMEKSKPPIRIIAPGKVYRNETITSRSHVFFHQVEALYIDKDVTFIDLLSTMDEYLKRLFDRDIEMRYRPSYFPFVEPGIEVDIRCLSCKGQGCGLCKHTGWLEIAGAGLVHPEVLKNGDIDPEEYTGFAWGMGVERVAMLKHGIKDIRMFTENNTRFLKQFSGVTC